MNVVPVWPSYWLRQNYIDKDLLIEQQLNFQGNLKISQDARFDEYECNVMFKKYIKLIIVIEIYISWTVMENLVHVYDSLQDYKGDRDRLNTGNLFYMLIEST